MFEKRNKFRVDFLIIASQLKASSVSQLRLEGAKHKVRPS